MSLVKITPAGESITCEAGQTVSFQFNVSNTSGKSLRYGAEVKFNDGDNDWITVEGSIEGDLADGVDTTVQASIAPPKDLLADNSEATNYAFRLRIYDTQKPQDAVDSATVSVEVQPAQPVEEGGPLIWPWIVAAVVAVIAIGSVTTWLLLSGAETMPDYTGQKWADIEEQLEIYEVEALVGYNNGTEFIEEEVDEYDEGVVISQNPEAGADLPEVADGERIPLQLQIGLETTTVPDTIGQSVAEAKAKIAAAGLQLGEITEKQTSDAGTGASILAQTPVADTLILPNSRVSLVIAKRTIVVPNLRGFTLIEAQSALESLGFTVEEQQIKKSGPLNEVLQQSPKVGTEAAYGSKVVISIPKVETVPRVIELRSEVATARLKALGFTVEERQLKQLSGLVNEVFQQDPKADTEVLYGSKVVISIPKVATVPALGRESIGSATKKLTSLGFTVKNSKVKKFGTKFTPNRAVKKEQEQLAKDVEVTVVRSVPEWEAFEPEEQPGFKGGYRWLVSLKAGDQTKLEAVYTITLPFKYELEGGNRRD